MWPVVRAARRFRESSTLGADGARPERSVAPVVPSAIVALACARSIVASARPIPAATLECTLVIVGGLPSDHTVVFPFAKLKVKRLCVANRVVLS
jgi:hypothetical protein